MNMDHHIAGGKNFQNSYHYSHRINTYDPNLGSAARFSPTVTYATETEAQQQQTNVDQNYQNVTYSNVVFVPDIGQSETGNGIIDPSQSYILPTDSRLYNTFVRTESDNGAAAYEDDQNNIISTDMTNHHHHLQQQQQMESFQLQTSINGYNLTASDDHLAPLTDPQNVVDSTSNTEIIMQQVNGEFYQQIQNIYVDNDHGNSIEIVPALIGDHFTEYENQSYYPTYEIESDLIMCTNDKAQREVVYVANDGNGTEQQVQMYINNQAFGNYKNEYTVLEPMNPQIMQQHIQQQEMTSTYQTNDLSMVSIQPVVMSLEEKEQQRLLLESTMSPLLAAVNDITSRDEQFQRYLTQSPIKEPTNTLPGRSNIDPTPKPPQPPPQYTAINSYLNATLPVSVPSVVAPPQSQTENSISDMHSSNSYRNNLKITNMHSATNEYVDINDMDFIENRSQMSTYADGNVQENLLLRRSQRRPPKKDDELTVSDKRVPSRAWATLPTTYLYIGKPIDGITEYTVFSKKDIPLRTKFGPLEGDIRICAEDEKMQLKNEEIGHFPLLFLGETSIVDVSNEYTSNWMRFVRLATTFREQNLQLHECDNKLYFQSCQIIGPKQEFKVGYSTEYANRYGLRILEPDDKEKAAIYEKNHPWPCFECEKKFESYELLQAHLNEHDKLSGNPAKNGRPRKRKIARRHRLTARKISGPTVRYACCYCSEVFSKYSSLKRHNEFVHSLIDCESKNSSVLTNSNRQNANKNYRCEICRRTFGSVERLEKHNLMHKTPMDPKLVQCTYCPERLLTPSALAMHIKSHLFKNRLFNCLFCPQRFRLATEVISHVQIHMENGVFTCQYCNKIFKKYALIRKHIRCYHSAIKHTCPECGKECTSRTKLKHHRLRHSDVREFLCSDCGKQFKRKDKLREHILSVHSKKNNSDDKMEVKKGKEPQIVKTAEKTPPDDYQRYIYKCHDCLLGFKRRGMLVNHMAKRHPNISIDSVPELNLPILKAQRYYYCQYCDKVYKSSGKRKAHILKNHPGAELPQSSRQQVALDVLGIPNPTFSETVGNVSTDPHRCQWCHKQYASKARLLQHQRKIHSDNISKISNDNQLDEIPTEGISPLVTTSHAQLSSQPAFLKSTQQSFEYETENKLLKLSSAALEASLKDDFHFFDASPNDLSSEIVTSNRDISTISKVDVNFKVVNADYVETSTASNGDLNQLPQLFEEIDYMDVKPVAISEETSDCYTIKKISYAFSQDSG